MACFIFAHSALHDAIASARNAGILFVAACGNNGTDNDLHPLYPASYADLDNIIAVAAMSVVACPACASTGGKVVNRNTAINAAFGPLAR